MAIPTPDESHVHQVKNRMTLESFRRNLRGVNENTDFPIEFLNDIYYSIAKVWIGLYGVGFMDA